MWCVCSEKPETTSSWGHQVPLLTRMSSKAVEAEQDVLQEGSSYLEAAGSVLLTASLLWWTRCFGSFMHPGPWVGPAGAALAANPASHDVSPSQGALPKGCCAVPCLCEPSWGASLRWAGIAASLPRLWVLARALFVFSSVSNVLCAFLARLISYNALLLQFLSAAQIMAGQT